MRGIRWCSNCQVPILSQQCGLCGTVFPKPLVKDLVPVFAEEMTLLRDHLGFFGLPARSQDFYLWNAGTSYYRLGKKAASISYKSGNGPLLTVTDLSALAKRPIRPTKLKDIPKRLYLANKTRIDSLEHEAIEFIRETLARFSNHVPMVAFSGGKDSIVVSALACKAMGSCSLLHVMADTTLETPETYRYLDVFRRTNGQIPLLRVMPSTDFWEMSSQIGPPSRIHRWCCASHKSTPMATVVGALRQKSAGVLTFDGIRSSESNRRGKYERVTYKHKIQGEILASPIQSWSDLEVWIYILSNGISYNKGYRYGFRRIGCIPCPFNSQWSRFLVSKRYSQYDKKWCSFLKEHAERIGHPNPEHFSKRGWRVRAGGRGMRHELASVSKEICQQQDRTLVYTLARVWSDSLLEYLKPFGEFRATHDDGLILTGEIIDPENTHLIATIRVMRPENVLQVTFAPRKNLRLLVQRFERQIKKYQSCVICGSCSAACPTGAISANGRFHIDKVKCTQCLGCVKTSCIAVESLTRKGKGQNWRVCDGSV